MSRYDKVREAQSRAARAARQKGKPLDRARPVQYDEEPLPPIEVPADEFPILSNFGGLTGDLAQVGLGRGNNIYVPTGRGYGKSQFVDAVAAAFSDKYTVVSGTVERAPKPTPEQLLRHKAIVLFEEVERRQFRKRYTDGGGVTDGIADIYFAVNGPSNAVRQAVHRFLALSEEQREVVETLAENWEGSVYELIEAGERLA